jgi:hypothetical protein
MLYTSPGSGFELTTSVVIGTDFIGSCKSDYHTITATTAPFFFYSVRQWDCTYLPLMNMNWNLHLSAIDRHGRDHTVGRFTSTHGKKCPSSLTLNCHFGSHLLVRWVTSGAGTAYPSEHLSSHPVFSGVLVFLVDPYLSFCTFSIGHCVVCFSSIYRFWLPLWHVQLFLLNDVLEPTYTTFQNVNCVYGFAVDIAIYGIFSSLLRSSNTNLTINVRMIIIVISNINPIYLSVDISFLTDLTKYRLINQS